MRDAFRFHAEDDNVVHDPGSIVYSRMLKPGQALRLKQERIKYLNSIQAYRNKWEEADCLLVSFAKCGSSWFRYCVEQISRRPTIGNASFDEESYVLGCIDLPLLHQIDNYQYESDCPILAKTHLPSYNDHRKLILLVRNYKEILSRPVPPYNCIATNKNKNYSKKSFKMAMEKNFLEQDRYFSLLSFFDNFENDKLIIFYEDLIEDFYGEMSKVVSFLNLKEERLSDFVQNYDTHKKTSIEMYTHSSTISIAVAAASDKIKYTDIDFPLGRPRSRHSAHNTVEAKYFNPRSHSDYDSLYPLKRTEYFYDVTRQIIFLFLDLGIGSDIILVVKDLKKEFKMATSLNPGAGNTDYLIRFYPVIKFLEGHPKNKKASEDDDYINAIYSGLGIEIRYSEPYLSYSANSKDLRYHSKKLLSKKECIAVDNFLQKKHKVLYNKYLSRYREEI